MLEVAARVRVVLGMAAEAAEATAQVMATEGARAAPAAMEVEREVDRVAAAVVVVEWGEGMDVAVLEENAVEYLEEWGGSWVWPYRQSLRDRQSRSKLAADLRGKITRQRARTTEPRAHGPRRERRLIRTRSLSRN